jgi:CTD kinase subunit alpha
LSKQGVLKIADFGLARELQIDYTSYSIKENFEYTNRVVTLWYRSPELLLGSTLYGFAVDMWSIGYFKLRLICSCIFLEMFSKTPIFQGKTEIEQCDAIFKVCGTPNPETWPDLVNMNWYSLVKFENYPPRMKAAFA